jgi:hypothetical protein
LEECVGSCALVRLENGVRHILTSRHVVFDPDEGGILIECISFYVGLQTYNYRMCDVKYHGSSDDERDLAFFEIIGEVPTVGGFCLSLTNIYQGQSIAIFGYR